MDFIIKPIKFLIANKNIANMTTKRVLAYCIAFLALGIAFYSCYEFKFIGFPDGFLSDFDRVNKILLIILISANISMALWSIFLGGLDSSPTINKMLFISIAGYLGFMVLFLFVQFCLRQFLQDIAMYGF